MLDRSDKRRYKAAANEVPQVNRYNYDEDWRCQASCRGMEPELWFPKTKGEALFGTDICKRCPVQEQCITWAEGHGEMLGTWGGVSQWQRRTPKKRSA